MPLNNSMHMTKHNKENTRYETNNSQNLNLNMVANATRKSNSNNKRCNDNSNMKSLIHSASMNNLPNNNQVIRSNSSDALSIKEDWFLLNKNSTNKCSYEYNIDNNYNNNYYKYKQKERKRELEELQKLYNEKLHKDKSIQIHQKQLQQYQNELKQKQSNDIPLNINTYTQTKPIHLQIQEHNSVHPKQPQLPSNLSFREQEHKRHMEFSLIKLNEQQTKHKQLLHAKVQQIEEIKHRHEVEIAKLKAEHQSQSERHLREIHSKKQKNFSKTNARNKSA